MTPLEVAELMRRATELAARGSDLIKAEKYGHRSRRSCADCAAPLLSFPVVFPTPLSTLCYCDIPNLFMWLMYLAILDVIP